MTFEEGKAYAVLGPNGSGKTTLLRIIAGIERCDEGKVIIENSEKQTQNVIAYLPQKPYIFDMTVLENVMLGLPSKSFHLELRAFDALKKVGMLDCKHKNARILSGGEAQRVALARTLVLDKDIIILDEPASFVDAYSVKLIEDYINEIKNKKNKIIIFTTHDMLQAQRIADCTVNIG